MTTKPRKAAKPSAVAEAAARYKAAVAAYDARTDNSDEISMPLVEAANEAFDTLGETPCASDAEFLEKSNICLTRNGG